MPTAHLKHSHCPSNRQHLKENKYAQEFTAHSLRLFQALSAAGLQSEAEPFFNAWFTKLSKLYVLGGVHFRELDLIISTKGFADQKQGRERIVEIAKVAILAGSTTFEPGPNLSRLLDSHKDMRTTLMESVWEAINKPDGNDRRSARFQSLCHIIRPHDQLFTPLISLMEKQTDGSQSVQLPLKEICYSWSLLASKHPDPNKYDVAVARLIERVISSHTAVSNADSDAELDHALWLISRVQEISRIRGEKLLGPLLPTIRAKLTLSKAAQVDQLLKTVDRLKDYLPVSDREAWQVEADNRLMLYLQEWPEEKQPTLAYSVSDSVCDVISDSVDRLSVEARIKLVRLLLRLQFDKSGDIKSAVNGYSEHIDIVKACLQATPANQRRRILETHGQDLMKLLDDRRHREFVLKRLIDLKESFDADQGGRFATGILRRVLSDISNESMLQVRKNEQIIALVSMVEELPSLLEILVNPMCVEEFQKAVITQIAMLSEPEIACTTVGLSLAPMVGPFVPATVALAWEETFRKQRRSRNPYVLIEALFSQRPDLEAVTRTRHR